MPRGVRPALPRSPAAVIGMRAFSAAVVALVASSATLPYPATPVHDVVTTLHGVAVHDPYRWLEDGRDPAVRRWASAQTALAQRYIHGSPSYALFERRIAALERSEVRRFGLSIRNGRWIYRRHDPGRAQAVLVARDGLSGAERVLFDPAAAAGAGPPPAIESVFVAEDGSKVAFTTQRGGSEEETLHVVDATTGELLAETLPHVGGGTTPTALAWDPDGKGFTHTLFPRNDDGAYAKDGILLYHHVLGTDASRDTYVFGRGQPRTAEYALYASRTGNALAVFVTAGDGVHGSIDVRYGDGPFREVATPADGIGVSADPKVHFVGETLIAVATARDGRGEVLGIRPGQTARTARVLVPASDVVVADVVPVPGGFATIDMTAGDSAVRLFAADGTPRGALPLPPFSSVDTLSADPLAGPMVLGYQSYTKASRWYLYDPARPTLSDSGIGETTPAGFARVPVRKVFVPSLDGAVRIPVEIVGRGHGATTPTILSAYGAYGLASQPFFSPALLAWLERGGVRAVAMVRGGGENGEAWHQAAHVATKTRSSDDLAAVAAWLGRNGFGDARHLGIVGRSAGGFLMGLALTRDPARYRAVVATAGFYDLVRVELTPNGRFNTPEFGTVTDPAQFPFMLAQSPYHHVRKGVPYPAVLLMTGENDRRVDPYMSRKMAAVLQADSASPSPILLEQKGGQGHGAGSSSAQRVEALAEEYAFFWSQLRAP